MDKPNSTSLPVSGPKSADNKPNAPSIQNEQGSSSKSPPTAQKTSDKPGASSAQTPDNQIPASKQSAPGEQIPSSSPDQSTQIEIDSSVLILNNSNFKQGIASKDPTLVFFNATWCGVCRKFKPKYKEVAKELTPKLALRFALYDCTNNEEDTILDEYKIMQFPTVKLFREGKYERDYDGKWTNENLTAFASKFAVNK